jgi:hypothetical protein
MKSPRDLIEERVIWNQRFQGVTLDFRGKSILTRFDCCEFVKCRLLINETTEQLSFTECIFCECNIDQLQTDEERALISRGNLFEPPLEERRIEFEKKLAKALSARADRGGADRR